MDSSYAYCTESTEAGEDHAGGGLMHMRHARQLCGSRFAGGLGGGHLGHGLRQPISRRIGFQLLQAQLQLGNLRIELLGGAAEL